MPKKLINIVVAVNSANVSKADGHYLIKDVVHALDGIVLNRRLYTGQELEKSVAGLNGRPAPAGHPKDRKGRNIRATNGEALSAAWIGAWCVNSRYEGGRAMCDIQINEAQAKALPAGKAVIERLDAAMAGTNTEPIAVSSGLLLREVAANGESRGKAYNSIAVDMEFDHLAILLNEQPAGTPEEGIGMFVNSEGQEEPVERVVLNSDPVDRRYEGAIGWLRSLFANKDISFDQIYDGLRTGLPQNAWVREVFATYAVWTDESGKLWRQDYHTSENGSVAWLGQPVEVVRQVSYEPVTTNQEVDIVKDQIIVALNAAGVTTDGLSDAQLLAAYNALARKSVEDKLTAANSRIAELEGEKTAAENAERDKLATELATNGSLSADDLKLLPVGRLRELKAKAAPVLVGNSGGSKADDMAGYSLNSHLEGAK